MQELKERMAYVKGLAAGTDLNRNSPEGRILAEMMDLLDEVIRAVDKLQIYHEDLEEYVGAIDEDLTDLENDFYDEYDEQIDAYGSTDETDDLDDIEYLELECPNCKELVYVDQDVFDDDDVVEVLCPECHEVILMNDDTPVVHG